MKQIMENIKEQLEEVIKKNLPEKKEIEEGENGLCKCSEYYYECNCVGFNQALSQINTSLIADEVLKVVVEKVVGFKVVGIPEEECKCCFARNKALDTIINSLTNSSTLEGERSEHLSPNKENDLK